MCSKEEVLKIVEESESRVLNVVHAEIDKLRIEVRTETEKSHMALAKTISNFGASVISASNKLEAFIEKKGNQIDRLEAWKEVHMTQSTYINEKIDAIQLVLSRLMWIVVTGVAVALLGLILK